VNTAWPHHPARDASRYRNTRNTYLPWFGQLLLFNQNLHLVHHLKPNLPWYKYPEYLAQHEYELRRQGSQTIQYTSRARPYEPLPEFAIQLATQARNIIQSYWH
jgi:fatty acid desaturase